MGVQPQVCSVWAPAVETRENDVAPTIPANRRDFIRARKAAPCCSQILWAALHVLLAAFLMAALPPSPARAGEPAASHNIFGKRLAAAARRQTWVPVIYDPAYRKIDYPGGDVPWYTGVCTDVVVRAYRDLGIDLQVLVHKARVGSGDRNIDHRRVPVLKKFFSRRAQSLPTTKDPAVYAPGDIVTYHFPNGASPKRILPSSPTGKTDPACR